MIELAGPLRPVKKNEGIYLEGFSRILYPTAASECCRSVQWHIESSSLPRERLEVNLLSDNWIRIGSPSLLAGARTFLGVFPRATIYLGITGSTDYYRNIRFSGASEEDHNPNLGAPTSITMGTSGLGIFGVTGSIPIIYGKSVSRATDNIHHNYLDILWLSKELPVILYDTGSDSERGWMVPMLCVILHMIHIWADERQSEKLC